MENYQLVTLFTSNTLLDCYILKGRLETEGLDCFIYDENYISVDPFKAVALRGVKLKVPADQKEYGLKILDCIKNNALLDADGEYDCKVIFENEYNRQNEILNLKNKIRQNPLLLTDPDTLRTYVTSYWIDNAELNNIILEETEFDFWAKKSEKIDWRNLMNNFFEYGFNFFTKMRPKPVNYYLEKEMVDDFCRDDLKEVTEHCPRCKSSNIYHSTALDFNWDILFLLFSFLLYCPFPILRSKYHCFDCGYDFKKKEMYQ